MADADYTTATVGSAEGVMCSGIMPPKKDKRSQLKVML
jgi:hypothetical protein